VLPTVGMVRWRKGLGWRPPIRLAGVAPVALDEGAPAADIDAPGAAKRPVASANDEVPERQGGVLGLQAVELDLSPRRQAAQAPAEDRNAGRQRLDVQNLPKLVQGYA